MPRSFGLKGRPLVWHTYRGLQRDSQGKEPGVQSISVLSLFIHTAHQYLQKGACSHHWCPDFCGWCQGTPLPCLALVASGAFAHGSHGTVTNREPVLKQLLPQNTAKSNRPRSSPGTSKDRHYLCGLPLLCSRAPASLGGKL